MLADELLKPPILEPEHYDLTPKSPPRPAAAKAMISMFMIGGPSQMDMFDPKDELFKRDGEDYAGDVVFDNAAQASRKIMKPMRRFHHHGECGMEMSELIPHMGSIADDITLIRSMHCDVNNHLPAFVALTDPRGAPLMGSSMWSNGPLPSLFQGTVVRPTEPRILNLDPPAHLAGTPQRMQLDLIERINQAHLDDRPGENDLEARISSYQLAARMQLSAKDAFDLSDESAETIEMYGINEKVTKDYGTRCLIARRLVERGVRFVQIFNNGQSWDHHDSILTNLPERCEEIDKPAAAMVNDLKQRGMLDETIVQFTGEMGRLPVIQIPTGDEPMKRVGRDHNTFGFSQWVAGGGFKAGYVHGATDDFSHHAVEDIVTHHDWLATVLHQFGLDHQQVKFRSGTRDVSLVENPAAATAEKLLA